MKKLLIGMILLLSVVANANVGKAYWTGKVKYITTITYQPGVQCEYSYAGQLFWKTFTGSSCPSSIEVN